MLRPRCGESHEAPALLGTLLVLLVSALLVSVVMEPGDEPPVPEAREGSGDDQDYFGSTPLYMIYPGVDNEWYFIRSLENLGDIDLDGTDDLAVIRYHSSPPLPYVYPWTPVLNTTQVVFGNSDKDLLMRTPVEIKGTSQSWAIGDVNGDGHADMLSMPYEYNWTQGCNISGIDPIVLEVRYGSQNFVGPRNHFTMENKDWRRILIEGIGDVNADGYDDVMVVRDQVLAVPEESDSGTGHAIIFFGSESGISSSPGWDTQEWDLASSKDLRWRYVGDVHHGDVNGDGRSDVLIEYVTTTRIHRIAVYLGEDDGLSQEPDLVLPDIDPAINSVNVVSPVSLDGDGYDDVVVTGQESGRPGIPVTHMWVFHGTRKGLEDEAREEYRYEKANLSLALTDMNGDGRDDLVHVTSEVVIPWVWPLVVGYLPPTQTDVYFEYFENEEGRFASHPTYQFGIPTITGTRSYLWPNSMSTVTGDFDGDGRGDLVVLIGGTISRGSANTPLRYHPGKLIFVLGGGVMDLAFPLSVPGGPRLYADYADYDFIVHDLPGSDLPTRSIRITLDPDGANVAFTWTDGEEGGDDVWERTGHDYARCTSTSSDARTALENGTLEVDFKIRFSWTWPHEDPCDVLVELIDDMEGVRSTRQNRTFSVENDLDILGVPAYEGEHQGILHSGDWVRGGEAITVDNLTVVYQGTTDVFPSEGVCEVVLYDDDGDFATVKSPSGDTVELTLTADNVTDTSETLSVGLQGLPEGARGPAPREFPIKVDADAPTLRNTIPDTEDWISANPVLVGTTADDGEGSGVDATSLEFTFRGSFDYGGWTRSGVMTAARGGEVDGMAYLDLPDGEDYYMRWRVRDLVGNLFVMPEEVRLRIDTRNVTFTDPVPPEDVWNNGTRVLCGVTITDTEGSGIDVSTIMYRVSQNNLSGYGKWKAYTGQHTDARTIEARTFVDLGEGPFNYIQWRTSDIAGNGLTVSGHFRVLVDITPITFHDFEPSHIITTAETEVTVQASDGQGSGVDYESIEYRTRSPGEAYGAWSPAVIDVRLTGRVVDGVYFTVGKTLIVVDLTDLVEGGGNHVQFRGLDLVGNGPTLSPEYQVTVDSTGPVILMLSPEEGVVHPEADVTITVSLTDLVSGIDPDRVQYRFGTDGEDSLGKWSRLPVGPEGDLYTGTVSIRFEPGRDNRVQFRCFDRLGNEGTSKVYEIWVNRYPSALIVWPEDGSIHSGGLDDALSGRGSHDPDGDELTYQWSIDGKEMPASSKPEMDVDMGAGTHHIILIVKDPYGGWGSHDITVTIEEPSSRFTTAETILLIIVVAIVIAGAVVYVRWRHQREP